MTDGGRASDGVPVKRDGVGGEKIAISDQQRTNSV